MTAFWNGRESLGSGICTDGNEAYAVTCELTDRNCLQRVGSATYIVMRWRERNDAGEEEVTW